MDKKVMISIIIPTYNIEKYVKQCVDSILKQSYKDYEIIIVDDGSTDSTLELLHREYDSNKYIQIYTQNNQGSGIARNLGLEKSNGKYIMFIDGDDWIEPKMLEAYINIINKYDYDLICSSYFEENYFGNNVKTELYKVDTLSLKNQNECRKKYIHLYLDELVCAPHRNLYKSEIIKKNNITFPDLRRSQDIVFNYSYFKYVNSLYVDTNIYYHYRIINNGNHKKITKDYLKTIEYIYSNIMKMIEEWNIKIDNYELEQFNNKFFNIICGYIESMIMANEDFDYIYENNVIKKIIEKSDNNDLYHRLLIICIRKKNNKMIKLLTKTKIYFKSHLNVFYFSIRRKLKK